MDHFEADPWNSADAIRVYVTQSEKGNPFFSWILVDALVDHFQSLGVDLDDASARLGEDFFTALAGVREHLFDQVQTANDQPSPIPKKREIAPVLSALAVVRGPGRPRGVGQANADPWHAIQCLEQAMSEGGMLERWGGKFFRELLRLRNDAKGLMEVDVLLPAFDCLNLTHRAGRPKDDEAWVLHVLASEELARHGQQTQMARAKLSRSCNMTDTALRDLRTRHPETARIVSPGRRGFDTERESTLTEAELRALAESPPVNHGSKKTAK